MHTVGEETFVDVSEYLVMYVTLDMFGASIWISLSVNLILGYIVFHKNVFTGPFLPMPPFFPWLG